jgi:hypothetical protein
MRLRHNKKRNTAFVYEALVRELTKSIIKNNPRVRNEVVSILKEYFSPSCVLSKELTLYKPLYDEKGISKETAGRLLFESRISYGEIDKKEVFNAQTRLINRINKYLGPEIFNNYVPNYKSIATVHSIFNADLSPKNRLILEEKIVGFVSTSEDEREEVKTPFDDLTYKTFINKFNQKYSEGLFEEQSKLLNHYISSMEGDSLELKIFLNEELGRIKEKLRESLNDEANSGNLILKRKTEKVLELAEDFKQTEVNDFIVENILKMQQLIREVDNAATG